MRKATWLVITLLVAFLAACSDPSTSGDDTQQPPPDAPPAGDGWAKLIGRDWMVPPGSADTYKCTRIMVTEDIWISGFRAIAPVGTHHTVVTFSGTSSPLGDYDCSVSSLDFQMLYASGVGTAPLEFPAGVGMKINKGQFINLNLHLFNASDQPISGTSGIEFKKIDPTAVVHQADMAFAGTTQINIPSDNQPHTVTGGCTLPRDWNTFTIWPHMHQFATHQTVQVTKGGQVMKLLDNKPYSFEEQVNYPMATLDLKAGDQISVTCTYVNNSGTTVTFGDSSNQEMCFTGFYKYPAGGNLFQCALN